MSSLPTLNIGWVTGDPQVRLLSNFAHTPFVLLELEYETVEGFWQGLKFPEGSAERAWLARMTDGLQAKREAEGRGREESFRFQGRRYRVGSASHHQLGEMALRAKFAQHSAARHCLVATGEAGLTHELLNRWGKPISDSRSWPKAVFTAQLMRIRTEIQQRGFRETVELPSEDPEWFGDPPSQMSLF